MNRAKTFEQLFYLIKSIESTASNLMSVLVGQEWLS